MNRHRRSLCWGGVALLCLLTSSNFAQELSKEYVRLGGRVVAIEGGFGVTVTQDVTAVGPGQFEFFTAVPSEAGIVVTCSAPAGSCTLDSLPENRW